MKARSTIFDELTSELLVTYKGFTQHKFSNGISISHGQKAVMFTIRSNGNVHVKQLAKMLHISSGAVTQHIETLEKLGIVKRLVDSQDKRHVLVSLTDKGETLATRLHKVRNALLLKIFEDIPDIELQQMLAITKKINYKLETIKEKT